MPTSLRSSTHGPFPRPSGPPQSTPFPPTHTTILRAYGHAAFDTSSDKVAITLPTISRNALPVPQQDKPTLEIRCQHIHSVKEGQVPISMSPPNMNSACDFSPSVAGSGGSWVRVPLFVPGYSTNDRVHSCALCSHMASHGKTFSRIDTRTRGKSSNHHW